jgi:hypothetical protein
MKEPDIYDAVAEYRKTHPEIGRKRWRVQLADPDNHVFHMYVKAYSVTKVDESSIFIDGNGVVFDYQLTVENVKEMP